MYYRKEIDGLRSVAVIPVILFHAGLDFIAGGFIGVDIFFVISGYLITGILVSEMESGKFSLKNFYERRARRILPALGCVLVITTVICTLVLPPHDLKEFSQSLVAVATFTSNIFFYLEGSYFGPKLEEMPLLHTWSLAVEEQYYIFFPLLLMATWRIGKAHTTSIIVGLSILSLGFAHYLIYNKLDSANFFLIFSRSWELFAGSLIALTIHKTLNLPQIVKSILSLIGLLTVLLSLFLFSKHLPHPSLYTLIPITGTSLIILFANQENLCGRILSNKFLVHIGLLSYSLYLWHQPVFSIAHAKIGNLGLLLTAAAVAFTYIFFRLTLN